MKVVIAVALLGLSAQIGNLQAREPATFFKPWRTVQGDEQQAVPSKPDRYHQQRPDRHAAQDRDQQRASLRHASAKVKRLERRKLDVIRALKYVRRHQPNRQHLRQLKRKLHRVSEHLRQARREYRQLKHVHSGLRQPQRWQQTTWHKQQKPYKHNYQSAGTRRPTHR